MNWFSATPSASETRRASANREFCSLRATLLFFIQASNLLPCIARLQGGYGKSLRRCREMADVESHEGSASREMLRPSQHSFVLHYQRHRNKQLNLSVESGYQQAKISHAISFQRPCCTCRSHEEFLNDLAAHVG